MAGTNGDQSRAVAIEVETAVSTDTGCVRETNEDSIAFIRPDGQDLIGTKGYMAVVADGMGGHSGGEIASRLAVTILPDAYYTHPGSVPEAMEAAFQAANLAIYQTANPEQSGMGTTCTALVIRGATAWCGHVGDSRLYLIRNDRSYLMTEDHSVVMELVRKGILSFAEAGRHPSRNVITRCVGMTPSVEVSLWNKPFPIQSGDVFILCTDGLYEYLEDGDLLEYSRLGNLDEACHKLIDLAKSRGGEDNLSVGLIRVKTETSGS